MAGVGLCASFTGSARRALSRLAPGPPGCRPMEVCLRIPWAPLISPFPSPPEPGMGQGLGFRSPGQSGGCTPSPHGTGSCRRPGQGPRRSLRPGQSHRPRSPGPVRSDPTEWGLGMPGARGNQDWGEGAVSKERKGWQVDQTGGMHGFKSNGEKGQGGCGGNEGKGDGQKAWGQLAIAGLFP